jgi:hypothetical protein
MQDEENKPGKNDEAMCDYLSNSFILSIPSFIVSEDTIFIHFR